VTVEELNRFPRRDDATEADTIWLRASQRPVLQSEYGQANLRVVLQPEDFQRVEEAA
jgi:hypothetical protein